MEETRRLTIEARYGETVNMAAVAVAVIGALLIFFSSHAWTGALCMGAAGAAFVFPPFRNILLEFASHIVPH